VLGIAVGYAGPAVIVSMIIAGTVALFRALSARGTRMGAGADLSNQNPKT
jgi:hypothetical protein